MFVISGSLHKGKNRPSCEQLDGILREQNMITYSYFKRKIFNLLPTGVLSISWSVGGSVASARAPSVSMMRLTQRS